MKTMAIFILLGFIISCTNKPRQKEVSQTPADTANGIDDTLQTVVIDTAIILFPYLLTKAEDSKEAYLTLTEKPEFPGGGMPKLMEFIQNNLQYDKARGGNDIKKRVIVQVIIDTDGTVTRPVILRGVSPALDKEALRVVKMMPKWKPGSQHGVPLKVKFTFPVTFEINPI